LVTAEPVVDDLGAVVALRPVATRVVSLVPSLTESIAATRPTALVGATDWCTRPVGLDVIRVRGTKNPDLAKVISLSPDLVLANQEENRRIDVERLRAAGVPVWVTVIESVDAALTSLRRMFVDALRWPVPEWLAEVHEVWRGVRPLDPVRIAVPIWRDPWMVVGARTFTGDLLGRLGLGNVYAGADDRYPQVTLEAIRAARPDVVLLPDEPYRFSADDGPEAFPGTRCALVDGRALTWYGPSLVTAPAVVAAALRGPG
jgi:ABC-type Fe3+-hydroxamate transport system substrate-binding protein